jgi:hypothetical protein
MAAEKGKQDLADTRVEPSFRYVRLEDAREVAGAVVLHAYGERELTVCCPLRLELALASHPG